MGVSLWDALSRGIDVSSRRQARAVVASIGTIASPAQGAGYFERDGYYAKDDPAHREASAWAGRGAEALGLSGPVDSDAFKAILEGRVPDAQSHQRSR